MKHHINPSSTNWLGRHSDSQLYWHELVQLVAELKIKEGQDPKIALLGYAVDAGIISNGGRSVVTGEVVPFNQMQLDHHIPYSNAGKIVAEKKSKTNSQKEEILNKLKETKAYFGIEIHYLEKLMGL
jgi:hypothetical protein